MISPQTFSDSDPREKLFQLSDKISKKTLSEISPQDVKQFKEEIVKVEKKNLPNC